MLCEEPSTALDLGLVNELLQRIRELAEDGITMMVVSHEPGFTRGSADRIVFVTPS
jgi:ABC-type polar amino acid transport system ATPase subunit